jgi:hypothetical protein
MPSVLELVGAEFVGARLASITTSPALTHWAFRESGIRKPRAAECVRTRFERDRSLWSRLGMLVILIKPATEP